MQNIRIQQINQLHQFFPNIVLTGRTQAAEELRIPLMLPMSAQPLYVRVTIPFSFPQTGPTIYVMHRVVHDKISKDQTY